MVQVRSLALAFILPAALMWSGAALAADGDEDGYDELVDCDDSNPDIHPDAAEVCDGEDTDCDVGTDEAVDSDGDTQSLCDGDCNDGYAWANTLDVDLDGVSTCASLPDCNDNDPALNPLDVDGDGFSTCEADCDDATAAVVPGGVEVCDGLDNDCDTELPADEVDDDLDGFSPCQGDCRDDNADRFPGNPEVCDGIDNDCDGERPVEETDVDGDTVLACDGDCNDEDATISSNASETCEDGIDNNCDGAIDAADVACLDQVPTADPGLGPQGMYLAGPVTLTFDGSASIDAEVGDQLVWTWNAGEDAGYPGVSVVSFVQDPGSPFAFMVVEVDPSKITHDGDSPNDSWDFPVTLTVNDGVQDSETITVTGHVYAPSHFVDNAPAVNCSTAPASSGGRAGLFLGMAALVLSFLRRRAA